MTTPVIGDILHLYPSEQLKLDNSMQIYDASRPVVALVSYVHGDGTYTAEATDHAGWSKAAQFIPLIEDGGTVAPDTSYFLRPGDSLAPAVDPVQE